MRVLWISSNGHDQRIFGVLCNFQSQDSYCRKICQVSFWVVLSSLFLDFSISGKPENLAHMIGSAKRKPQIWHGSFWALIFGPMIFLVLLEAQNNFLGLEFCSHSIMSVLKS